ncbi:acetylcholinesterase-like [Haemaphysalis longicornis]
MIPSKGKVMYTEARGSNPGPDGAIACILVFGLVLVVLNAMLGVSNEQQQDVVVNGSFGTYRGTVGSDNYDGRALAALGDVVVVVPNSRLGVLGFLNLPVPGVPSNAGLLDQAEALNWTARNIGFFGGDESDLVVVGHGSGASALAYHLWAREELTAFANVHKVVFMSESPLTRYPVCDNGVCQTTASLAGRLCEPELPKSLWLHCLRTVPVQSLLRVPPEVHSGLFRFFPVLNVTWGPTTWKHLNVLVGFSDDEGSELLTFINSSFRFGPQNMSEQVRSVLSNYYGFSPEDAKNITSLYDKGQRDGNFAEELFSDLLVVCPVRLFAEQLHAWGHRVHTYVLHRTRSEDSESGVPRGQSVRLLFGYPVLQQAEESETALSTRVISHWAHFFKTGQCKETESGHLQAMLPRVVALDSLFELFEAGRIQVRVS